MPQVELKPASVSDIPVIAALATKIWYQHYPTIISIEQIEYMLSKMYSSQGLTEQMTHRQHQFMLITIDNNAEGFISVHEESNGNWFINKYYINQELAGGGIGSKAFSFLLKKVDPKTIRLTVNRQNYKSINFYFKNGFVIEKVADFDIGEGYVMNDFVMLWQNDKGSYGL